MHATCGMWGPLTEVHAVRVNPPDFPQRHLPSWADGVARHRDAVAANPHEWDGERANVASLHVPRQGVVVVSWWPGTWAETLWRAEHAARFGHPVPPCSPAWTIGLDCLVWLRCSDGVVAARRSPKAHGWHGRWLASAAEGLELAELGGVVDLPALGTRACVEELGVTPVAVTPWRWQQTWAPGWSTRLYLMASTPLSLDAVREANAAAADGHEADRLEVVERVPAGAWVDGVLRP
jgi:hypothetical protein